MFKESSENWYENKNDYVPFVKYMLGVIVGAYREFSSRIKLLITQNISKPERIEEIIKNTLGTITKGNRRKMSGYQCGNDTENTGRITDSRKNFKNRRWQVYEIYLE